jgi:signal transduction histidine kinase
VLLDSLRTVADGGLPVSIRGLDGQEVYSIGSPPVASDSDVTPPLGPSTELGPFRRIGDEVLYWVSIPVRQSDTPLGWITQRRRFGTEGAALIESLIGGGASLRIGRSGDAVWVDLDGEIHPPPPTDVPTSEPIRYVAEGGGEALAVAGALEGTPWIVLLEMPMTSVLARAQAFLTRLLVGGSILLAIVVVIAWRSGMRLVVPLRELTDAADAMAAGDYQRRVPARGDDEVGRLARNFNAMAEEVARSHAALTSSLAEATDMAFTLEMAQLATERARKEAESGSRDKSRFLATMSHELRTPISAVINYTELLRMGVPDPPTAGQCEYLDRIELASQLLVALVNDVLEYSRLESGQLRVQEEVGRAATAIELAMTAMEPTAHSKQIDLSSDCPDDASFMGDIQRVQQIVLNLVSNAVKFTPEGGRVSVRCLSDAATPPGMSTGRGRWLRIEVEDNGIGIAQEDLERIFEPFVQGSSGFTWDQGGAGLGLAISRRLATLMSGAVTVESEPERGSRFTLWLRAALAPKSAVRA